MYTEKDAQHNRKSRSAR